MLRITKWTLVVLVLAMTAAPAFAQEQAPKTTDEALASAPQTGSMAKAVGTIGVCLGAGLCVVGGGFAIARIGSACIESIARQPEAGGAMFAPMVVAAAMVEGGMLFAIVVCLLGVVSL